MTIRELLTELIELFPNSGVKIITRGPDGPLLFPINEVLYTMGSSGIAKITLSPFPQDQDYEPVYTVRDLIYVLESSRLIGATLSSLVLLQEDKDKLLQSPELRQVSLLTPAHYGKFPDPKNESEFNTKELRGSIVILSSEPEIFGNYTGNTKV
jgi:hypothetical protein